MEQDRLGEPSGASRPSPDDSSDQSQANDQTQGPLYDNEQPAASSAAKKPVSQPHARRIARPSTASSAVPQSNRAHLLPSSAPAPVSPTTPDASDQVSIELGSPSHSPQQSPRNIRLPVDDPEAHDWATFLAAYAAGLWDPARIPNPPRATPTIPSFTSLSAATSPSPRHVIASTLRRSNTDDFALTHPTLLSSSSPHHHPRSAAASTNSTTASSSELSSIHSETSSRSSSQPPARPGAPLLSPALERSLARRRGSPDLAGGIAIPPVPQRFSQHIRTPLPTAPTMRMTASSPGKLNLNQLQQQASDPPQPTDLTAAATVRWAGSDVNIGPLALPSPEYELLDPLRNYNTAIPGSYNDADPRSPPAVVGTPGLPKKTRLGSFWQGAQDINLPTLRSTLSTIAASPLPSPNPPAHLLIAASSAPAQFPSVSVISSSTTAVPTAKPSSEAPQEDYFGPTAIHSSGTSAAASQLSFSSESSEPLPACDIPETLPDRPDPSDLEGTFFFPKIQEPQPDETQVQELPQPTTENPQVSPSISRLDPLPSTSTGSKSRKLQEQTIYETHGFLPAPFAINETERQRALYRFNVMHTGKDSNFDRIVHLVKLVFNTKIVVINLVDSHEQFFKSSVGLDISGTERNVSFCAHATLQPDDEPLIILDAREDWRFAQNPFVTGAPYVRFYAGAALRTHDGYNIGTLCIIDDQPRTEFGPRQRHTLKEFAAIVMREMELWKDKIQLRIRDRIQTSMERFTRECLEIDTQTEAADPATLLSSGGMEKVYDRAAKLVKRTLDVQGAVVMDVSHFHTLETSHAESSTSVTLYHSDPPTGTDDGASKGVISKNHPLSTEDYKKIVQFFANHPEGQIFSDRVPAPFRNMIPDNIQYAMIVPIFHVDKHPFALLCAYTLSNAQTKHFLEGFELVYLRAIGVIILSAVLKRKMHLADKSKSLFISNISHELRTPLHGILAAAELLADTELDSTQSSFLQTVQACGTSLVETVNHVLDFTKLSGNTRGGGVESVIPPSKVDLVQLVEEAVEGCWIGAKARFPAFGQSGIGNLYSPPSGSPRIKTVPNRSGGHVEVVVDIGPRELGWTLVCEKGGMRRVLMNLIGNSIKFTTDGFIQIILRELPPDPDTPPGTVKVELGVHDTGKGISKDFLKNQLFHPFSQENPLQPGTGLGLSIVNSIVRSESVNGSVDVWSTEGVGTEIRVTFHAQIEEDIPAQDLMTPLIQQSPTSVSLVGFDDEVRGFELLRTTVTRYIHDWWGFDIASDEKLGDVLVMNEDVTLLDELTARKDVSHPVVVLSSNRGDTRLMTAVAAYERLGGFARIMFKPGGPSRLRQAMQVCLHMINIRQRGRSTAGGSVHARSDDGKNSSDETIAGLPPKTATAGSATPIIRRRSEDHQPVTRPVMTIRTPTYHISSSPSNPIATSPRQAVQSPIGSPPPDLASLDAAMEQEAMISIGEGQLKKAAAGSLQSRTRQPRTLIIEDNEILRDILSKWLRNRKCEFSTAVDGIDGVQIFESEPPGTFDIVLLDMSMPRLDGIGATTEIRRIEASRRAQGNQDNAPSSSEEPIVGTPPADSSHTTRIVALTGMSSLDQKRKAFAAGVDGYLVKPVSLKTLDSLFSTLRVG